MVLLCVCNASVAYTAREGCRAGNGDECPEPLGNLVNFYKAGRAHAFVMGPEETLFSQFKSFSDIGWPAQRRIAQVRDQSFDMILVNTDFDPEEGPSIGNPDYWITAVHYPQGLGVVDTAIHNWALQHFAHELPVSIQANEIPLDEQGWLHMPDDLGPINKDNVILRQRMQLFSRTASLAAFLNPAKTADSHSLYAKLLQSYVQGVKEKKYAYYGMSSTMYHIFAPSKRYVSIVFTTESYSPGAMHNNTASTVLSFDRTSGKALTIADIFPDPAFSEPLVARRLQHIFTGINPELGEEAPQGSVLEAFQGMFSRPESLAMQTERIVLTPEGLVFIFDPYVIASYGEGTVQLLIPRKELKALGVNMDFWK